MKKGDVNPARPQRAQSSFPGAGKIINSESQRRLNGICDSEFFARYFILFFNKKQTLFIEKAPLGASPICAKAQMTSHTVSDALTRY